MKKHDKKKKVAHKGATTRSKEDYTKMNDKKQEKTHKTAADAKIAHINEKRGRATKRRGGQFMLKTTGIIGEREFQPIDWIIDEILPPGLGIVKLL